MRKHQLALLLFLFSLILKAQDPPKLVVGIVVDQMRPDYLYRFQDKFQEGGFKRLMNDGFQFKNMHYNYVPTYTAPGHASIYTGTTPAYHGIIGNSWYDKKSGMSVYCVSDPGVSGIGGRKQNGAMSPKNLKSSTITDELLLSTNFRSKVVGISIKDRGAVLPAGHNPTGSYWFDSSSGNFMTSTWYMDELPEWATKFNKSRKTNEYLSQTWNTLLPIEDYVESTPDEVAYEQLYKGKEKAIFPYDLSKLAKDNGLGVIRSTPFGNSIVLDMALAALEGEDLGADDITDFLAVSFSSTDYIGHQFGPNSIELQDTYLRLDLEIKRLLDFLDERFKDEYIIFLSADHGVAEVPLLLEDQKMVGGYLNKDETQPIIQEKIEKALGKGEWIDQISNDQIFLNYALIEENKLNLKDVRNTIRDIVLELDEIAFAYTSDELILRNSSDPMKQRFERGYNQKMSGDIISSLKPGYLTLGYYGKAGTTHGSSYTYDTHVPLLFYGMGIKQGQSVRPVSITDIAPTLSMLLNISLPSAATGVPLEELFD